MIPLTVVNYVIARFPYSPSTDRELLLKVRVVLLLENGSHFEVGDKIELLEERGEWTLGRNAEKTVGYFPTSFVAKV